MTVWDGLLRWLEGTPAAALLLKAVAAPDFEGYKKSMTKEAAKGIDAEMKESGLTAKQGAEMIKAMAPNEVKFTALKVDGKKATLQATGKVMGGEATYGTMNLQEEDGQWKVADQSWTNKK